MSESGYDYEDALTDRSNRGRNEFRTSNPALPAYSNPVVFVTPQTLEDKKHGIPDSETVWDKVSVKNMAELESYVALLRRQYPDFTVYAVPQLAAAASNRDSVGVGVPMDMRRVTEVLSFMIAALLAATNLSILMLSRKNEIGILRALGATQWNIISMVLAESMWMLSSDR